MNKTDIIKKLDKLKELLKIPTTLIEENSIYVFAQETEEIFEFLITNISNNNKKSSSRDIISIGNHEIISLFEEIKNPVLLYEDYYLYNNNIEHYEDMTHCCSFLFMWDYKDTKVFYSDYYYDCPYHMYYKTYLWTQTLNDFLTECNCKEIKNIDYDCLKPIFERLMKL